MKVSPTQQTREECFAAQIERSENKYQYVKASVHDARKDQALLRRDDHLTLKACRPELRGLRESLPAHCF